LPEIGRNLENYFVWIGWPYENYFVWIVWNENYLIKTGWKIEYEITKID
jgi:hypothetical protein